MGESERVAEPIDEPEPLTALIEASICETNDLEVTPHGMGFDLAQNGLVIHIEHGQIDDLVRILTT